MASGSDLVHKFKVLGRIISKRGFRALGGFNRVLQSRQRFAIKQGYHHASTIEHYDDRNATDEYQPSVYEFAATIAEKRQLNTITDVGCGSGYKLIHYLGDYDTTGIEMEPAFSWLKKQYPDRKWLLGDEVDPGAIHSDLVICSDVIEHINNPDTMMQLLQKMHFKYLIISTPERDIVAGKSDFGPPQNIYHYREWNAAEFYSYASAWFTVESQQIFHDRSITQVLLCTPNTQPH